MDVLADVLRAARAQGSWALQVLHDPPWAVLYRPSPPLMLHAVVRGAGWIAVDGAEPVRLAEREVAVVRGPVPHKVADALETPAQLVVEGAERCTEPAGPGSGPVRLAPRTYGRDRAASTVVVSGSYPWGGHPGSPLLDALPPVLHLSADRTPHALLDAISHEIPVDEPGQETVLDGLLDALLIRTLRGWFGRSGVVPPAWFGALDDPVVGPALRRLHERPGESWTVAGLAAAVGVSRAGLARRFKDRVGRPPLTYLTNWRMTLAASMLRDPGPSVTEIAHRVGYTDAFAFATAFKRVLGTTPSDYRASCLRH
ncbi:AraC family transcriptional regulator [Streptomyces sp. NPDC056987]|uniref:AraC family transcriptional regulator n=1 Tax=Streptomyces sp. NPDC056987 TaxID=3345988 RepID=UPI00363DF536